MRGKCNSREYRTIKLGKVCVWNGFGNYNNKLVKHRYRGRKLLLSIEIHTQLTQDAETDIIKRTILPLTKFQFEFSGKLLQSHSSVTKMLMSAKQLQLHRNTMKSCIQLPSGSIV